MQRGKLRRRTSVAKCSNFGADVSAYICVNLRFWFILLVFPNSRFLFYSLMLVTGVPRKILLYPSGQGSFSRWIEPYGRDVQLRYSSQRVAQTGRRIPMMQWAIANRSILGRRRSSRPIIAALFGPQPRISLDCQFICNLGLQSDVRMQMFKGSSPLNLT